VLVDIASMSDSHDEDEQDVVVDLVGDAAGRGWDDSLMEVTLVDPRDVTWEVDLPTYRVYFWTQGGSACDEWRVTNSASVHDVLAWAMDRVGEGRSYQVFVEVPAEHGLGILRLAGADPTSPQGLHLT
jgi:hypothetical protein